VTAFCKRRKIKTAPIFSTLTFCDLHSLLLCDNLSAGTHRYSDMKRALFLIPLLSLSISTAQAETAAKAELAAQTQPAETTTEKNMETDTAAAADQKDTAKPDNDAAKTEAETVEDGNIQNDKQNAKAVDATLRLREKLASVDTELATISKPSRSLVQRCKSRKNYINDRLEHLDKVAMEVAALQERFNSTNNKEFDFTIVRGDDRDKYVRDGKAAYNAMVIDMKEKKSSRKIGGLDKFEIMRERYQGMPEFIEANEWYNRTIDSLEKKWTKMQANEKTRRAKMASTKKEKMNEDDERDFEKLEKQLKNSGENIAKVWYVPSARNLRMLTNCLNKVHDVQRRREYGDTKNENIGCVPTLLTEFWAMMDNARALLLRGDLPGAQKVIDDDPTFDRIVRLNRNIMPNEYKEPIKDQRMALIQEIKRRASDNSRTQRQLENKIAELERTSSNVEARLDALLEDIERERALDAGENQASLSDAELNDDSKSADSKTADSKSADSKPAGTEAEGNKVADNTQAETKTQPTPEQAQSK